jgi:hypothetical protein
MTDYKILSSVNEPDLKKNNRYILALFWLTILFQVTGLKYIWSLVNISRFVNLSVLIILIVYAIKVVGSGYYSKKIWNYILIPGMLIFGGMFLNISLNSISNLKLITYFGLTLPWITYLIIPALMRKGVINTKTLWRIYYYFMLYVNILGILEYILVYYGVQHLRILHTPFGIFLGSFFSLHYMYPDGTAGYRYYSCFMEPGTLAMFLLPAITYAFFNKRYGGLFILLVAFFLTYSLGGIISLLILIILISFILFNRQKKYLILALAIALIISGMLWVNFGESVIEKYEGKNISAKVRENNFTKAFSSFPALVINNPLGLKLSENTKSFEKNKYYIGSNFSPGFYLQYGGISSLAGYLMCLFVSFGISFRSLKRDDLSLEEKVVFPSILVLLPFILQRSTIWECGLFAFLFAPSIIRIIDNIEERRVQIAYDAHKISQS